MQHVVLLRNVVNVSLEYKLNEIIIGGGKITHVIPLKNYEWLIIYE